MPTLAQVAVTSVLITGLVKFVQAPVGKGLEAAVRGFIVGALVGAAAFWLGGSVAVGIGGTVKNFFFLGGFGNATATAVFVSVLAVLLGVKAIFGVISSFGDFRLNQENKGKPFKFCSAFVASYLGEILRTGLGGTTPQGDREAAQHT